jgi:NADPH:quinone reductase-like Zn-dependent oxidoreductase
MKASVNTRYGSPDVLALQDIPAPLPAQGEIRVKVHATTVGRTDACALRAHPFFVRPMTGMLRPKRTILGLDFAGTVEATGTGVTTFAIGDRVFGLTPGGYGAHAEFVCVPADSAVAAIPKGKRFAEVIVCEGAWYANMYLQEFDLSPGQKILIYGASGAIGTAAVQLARYYGAEITAVVGTKHIGLAENLGADDVVDYTETDFTAIGSDFDFVLDAVGKTSYFECRRLLKPTGVFAATDLGPWWQNIYLALWSSITGSGRVVFPTPTADQALVEFIRDRVESGDLRAVVDRKYPFVDIADAFRYVDTQQKTGIVVVEVVTEVAARTRFPAYS